MEISLIRKFFTATYTIGRFVIDGEKLCDTLEDPVRDLEDINHDGDFDDPGEGKIYGETAIPYGRYQVINTYSPKFKRRMPELLKVPGFTAIRIHAGANSKHTEGCILVGDNKIRGQLVNGPYYATRITQMIDDADYRGERTYITIK